jgi:predicted AlkP superfamily phosphohydrolase/phosphomutase
MSARPLLVIGLDGFDHDIAARLMAEGKLPHLRRLETAAHRFRLEHGIEKYTGLAWEQFSSGLTPEAADRWSEVSIDTESYVPHQHDTWLSPFTTGLARSTVVFDVPYFNLPATTSAQGVVCWGAHDPGIRPVSSPPGIHEEITQRFGPYPAGEFIYGHVWPNAERTRAMGQRLVESVAMRSDVVRWLLSERLPAWDLALTVIGEYHSAVEALWHGWDEEHPLHRVASAPAAREGLIGVYEAADRMLGEMLAAFPAARVLAFAAHGMGRNLGDVPAMLLVPELMYRHFTGKTGFTPDPAWPPDGTGSPDLASVPHWASAINDKLTIRAARTPLWRRRLEPQSTALDWMPAARYRPAWPGMRAYVVPAYYDARIRVNLKGREARGLVPVRHYARTLDEVTAVLEACTDPVTSRPLDIEIDRRDAGDPRDRHATDADLRVLFKADYYAFEHPRLGTIGPAPCRRTGGHTGGLGIGYYLDGSATGRDLGTFRTLEVSDAVRALVDGARPAGPLGAALRAAG